MGFWLGPRQLSVIMGSLYYAGVCIITWVSVKWGSTVCLTSLHISYKCICLLESGGKYDTSKEDEVKKVYGQAFLVFFTIVAPVFVKGNVSVSFLLFFEQNY